MSNGLRALNRPRVQNAVTVSSLAAAGWPGVEAVGAPETTARKLSAVDRCIELLSDSIAKLPNYVLDAATKERPTHPILQLLNVRPNEAMTPFVRKKVLETSRLEGGNGYDWIIRDPITMEPKELIPIPWQLVEPWMDTGGRVWYTVTHPYTGAPMVLPSSDICHYKGATRNGLKGISVLQRASEVIASARAAQQYNLSYYRNGGQPRGILSTQSDLGGFVEDPQNPKQKIERKRLLQRDWEQIYGGPQNSFRIAVLDFGTDYKPLAASNKDAQFVENQEVSIRDIARYFGMPLYKLQEGKQAYGSNEQNAIEYVVQTLHPIVTGYEEEQTWKLLTDTDLRNNLEIRINLMAELRGDIASRGAWYKTMREVGAFSVNDVLSLEDLPNVEGGNERQASLNFVPLSSWPRLSEQRNGGSDPNANQP